MVIRTAKQKTTKKISAVEKESVAEDKRLLASYRKENIRLQNLIAKNQVKYESEINRIRAELSEKTKPAFNIVIGDTHNKSSGNENKNS